jgi:hypothetical protein
MAARLALRAQTARHFSPGSGGNQWAYFFDIAGVTGLFAMRERTAGSAAIHCRSCVRRDS